MKSVDNLKLHSDGEIVTIIQDAGNGIVSDIMVNIETIPELIKALREFQSESLETIPNQEYSFEAGV